MRLDPLELDQEVGGVELGLRQRLDRDPEAGALIALAHVHAVEARVADRLALLGGLPQSPGHRGAQLVGQQVEQVGRGAPAPQGQDLLGPAEDVQELVVPVDQHRGRHVAPQQLVIGGQEHAVGQAPAGGDRAGRTRADRRHHQAHVGGQADVAALAVDLPVAVDGVELVRQLAGRLAGPQEQIAAGLEAEVEQGQRLLLGRGLEVDEQVAAAHQVQAGEGRVADDVVTGEHHHLAQLLADAEPVALAGEVPLVAAGADMAERVAVVDADAGALQGLGVDIGGEDLGARAAAAPDHGLVQEDGERVHLLAGGAAGHPHPHVVLRVDQVGNHVALEVQERLRVAEEAGDADEQITVERVELVGVVAEVAGVALEVIEPGHAQPALDPSHHRAGLVVGELDPVGGAQQRQDLADAADLFGAPGRPAQVHRVAHRGARVAAERLGDGGGRQLRVDHPGVDGAARHAVETGHAGLLTEDQAAGPVDVDDPARTVTAGPRQDHGDGARAHVLGQRPEEVVDGQGQATGRILVGEQQSAARQDHVLARRDQIDPVRLDRHTVRDLLDGDGRVACQELVHPALEVRRQVLEDDEREAGVLRHGGEQGLQGLQSAGRRAHSRDVEGGLGGTLLGRCAVCVRVQSEFARQ